MDCFHLQGKYSPVMISESTVTEENSQGCQLQSNNSSAKGKLDFTIV